MIVPDKFTPYSASILSQLPGLDDNLTTAVSVRELYGRLSADFDSISDFVLALDVLYVLGRVAVDLMTGEVRRVD